MGNSVRDWRVPFAVHSTLQLAIGAGPETGRKKVNGTQFPFGVSGSENQNSLTSYSPTKVSGYFFFVNGEHVL